MVRVLVTVVNPNYVVHCTFLSNHIQVVSKENATHITTVITFADTNAITTLDSYTCSTPSSSSSSSVDAVSFLIVGCQDGSLHQLNFTEVVRHGEYHNVILNTKLKAKDNPHATEKKSDHAVPTMHPK